LSQNSILEEVVASRLATVVVGSTDSIPYSNWSIATAVDCTCSLQITGCMASCIVAVSIEATAVVDMVADIVIVVDTVAIEEAVVDSSAGTNWGFGLRHCKALKDQGC
jgi:hypothetical protein